MFAEFLLFLLVFPLGHTSVGVTVNCWGVFLLFGSLDIALFGWGR